MHTYLSRRRKKKERKKTDENRSKEIPMAKKRKQQIAKYSGTFVSVFGRREIVFPKYQSSYLYNRRGSFLSPSSWDIHPPRRKATPQPRSNVKHQRRGSLRASRRKQGRHFCPEIDAPVKRPPKQISSNGEGRANDKWTSKKKKRRAGFIWLGVNGSSLLYIFSSFFCFCFCFSCQVKRSLSRRRRKRRIRRRRNHPANNVPM